MIDHQRARRIVKLAVTETESSYLKNWLERDEHGVWEQDALALIELSRSRADTLGLTEEQVDRQIACVLVVRGLTVLLEDAKKRKAGKPCKRRTSSRSSTR